jgi:hypothetical protein
MSCGAAKRWRATMTANLATRNSVWLTAPRDTMAVFVDSVLVVHDSNLAYTSLYCNVCGDMRERCWNIALMDSVRLRNYAHASSDINGEYVAHLLVACSFVALERYGDALREIGTQFNAPGVRPVHLWHAMLAHTVRGIALHAQGDDAIDAFQMALECDNRIEGWLALERMHHTLNAGQRRLTSVYYSELRQTLRDALRETITRLAVMV